jgi:hypothetical protein
MHEELGELAAHAQRHGPHLLVELALRGCGISPRNSIDIAGKRAAVRVDKRNTVGCGGDAKRRLNEL